MIIELFGLPGVGKTTLARALAERNNFEVIKIKSKGELIFLNLVYLIKHPIKFFATFFYVIENSNSWPLFYYKFTNCFLHYNAKYQKALKFEKAILDQGYFQNVLSIFEKPISAALMSKYLKHLLLPDKLVILDLSFDVLQSRLANRGYPPRQNLGPQYLKKWLEAVMANYRLFLENINKLQIDYSIVDASRDSNDVYNEVWQLLNLPQPSFLKEGAKNNKI